MRQISQNGLSLPLQDRLRAKEKISINKYEKGTLLKIPVNTKMNVKNLDKEVLELIVVKAPAPKI